MPAGVTASNIRNNRKKLNQLQGPGNVGVNDSSEHNDFGSFIGSEGALGVGPGGRRRVGMN